MKRIVSGIILTILLIISILTLAFYIQPVKASGTIYIRANGSVDPPDAPITSVDNVTYTLTGSINDSIVVERDNIVVDGAGYTVQGPGTGGVGGINLTGRSAVTIKNMEIKAFTYGIYLYQSSNNNVSGNSMTANAEGIDSFESSCNIISGNNIANNWYGIVLSKSSNNRVIGNNITANNLFYGIWISSSSGNGIYHNNFVNNRCQIYTTGSTNDWDDGYPFGGNYWSDYNGTDFYSGRYQNITGSDGIGDTPYVIEESDRDNYPLMEPWSPPVSSTRYPWSMFHHDLKHTGYSESPAPNTNKTQWIFTAGDWVASSPAVANGKVYIGSYDRELYCLDALTGKYIWSYTTGHYVVSSPAVADGKVYFGSYDGKVYCLDASTGTHIWNYTAGHLVGSSPAVANGKLYFGSYDYKVYCLDALTGAYIWTYTTGGAVVSSPAVADGKLYFGSIDGELYCLDASTGAYIWSRTTYILGSSSAAVAGGKVYVGSFDGKVWCFDALTGAQIWIFTTGNAVVSSPAVAGGKIYVGSVDGKVYCLDALTGTHIWNYTAGDWVASSPAVADGKVYFGSYDGKVYCLDASTGTHIWSYQTDDLVYSSPAVADGMVFVGSYDHAVYAFGNVIRVPEDYKTVQEAIKVAPSGATIIVAPGIYNESLTINKTLTIIGLPGSSPIFSGGGTGIAYILLPSASGSIIAGIVITHCDQGILIIDATNIKIYDNIMSLIDNNGITLEGSNAANNLIYSNIFQESAVAINLTASSTDNNITKNIITSNNIGLNLESSGNIIYANTIAENTVGINMSNSNNNVIYHNNFVDNTVQISILTSIGNTWDNGYPSGGNYWGTQAIVDQYKGPSQNQLGSDGINDTQYTIAVNNVDRYPLVQPFNAHDVGVTHVIISKTIIGQGFTLCIDLRILNYGVYDETFTLIIYANTSVIATQTIALTRRNSTTIIFNWNTTGVDKGNYTISAYAVPVIDETDFSDNTFVYGVIVMTIPGDLNGERTVDIFDAIMLSEHFGHMPPDAHLPSTPQYNACYNTDINNDGAVNIFDAIILAENFGKTV